MEKDQFLDAETKPWWLVQKDVEETLNQKRQALGLACNFSDPLWYADRTKLEELYQFLELNHADLLKEPLDLATDVDKREQWLDAVIVLKKPPAAKGDGAAPPSAPPAPPPKAGETTSARAGTTAEAPTRKPSAFGRARTTEDAGGAATGTPAADTPGAQTAPAAPGAPPEPAKKSIFKAKKAAEPAAPTAPPPPAAGQPSLDELKETLSGLAANPDIPISEEEFQQAVDDPQFGAKLAAAEAELQSELEAELEAELAAEREA